MNAETKEKLKNLSKQLLTAKAAVNLTELETMLHRYHDFILFPVKRIEKITDYESYLAFMKEWKECGKLKNLKTEYAKYYNYMALAGEYNATLLPLEEKITEFVPVFTDKRELAVLSMAEEALGRNLSWENVKARMLSEDMKKAIYKHVITVLPLDTLISEIHNKNLTEGRIKSLPLAVSECEVLADNYSAKDYSANLAALYDEIGMHLEAPVVSSEKVKGVTFEGRSEKLLKIWNVLKEKLPEGAENFDVKEAGDDAIADIRNNLHIEFERYIYTDPEGNNEPAIRVLASLKGDKLFRKVDIGNISRDLAIELDATHKDAALTGEIEAIGLAPISGATGTTHQPYARVTLSVTDKPLEKTMEKDNEQSEEALKDEEIR